MRTLLVVACISVFSLVSATEPVIIYPEKIAELFSIRVDQVESCINQTKVTGEDFKVLGDDLTPPNNKNVLEQNNTRRAVCALTCAAQARGLMDGAKLQISNMLEFVDGAVHVPQSLKIELHEHLNLCYAEAKDFSDECEVFLKFALCFIKGNLSVGL